MSKIDFQTEAGVIAAYRYLAFLEMELRWLKSEIFPEAEKGAPYAVPCDSQVDRLVLGAPPTARAETVLRALGIDPHAEDCWTGTIWAAPLAGP